MSKLFLLLLLLGLTIATNSPIHSIHAQESAPVTIQVDGKTIVLRPGENVSPENYALAQADPEFSGRANWVLIEGLWEPLAPGVSVPLEVPQVLQEWSQTDVSTTDYFIQLAVPAFNQNDSAWKDNVMQTCGSTIGHAGCALTSTAMVFKYYGATNKNPGQLNSCLGNYACPIYWSTAATSCSESKASWVGSYTFSYSKLQNMLSANRPPIVLLTKGGSTHFVVVTGGSGSLPGNYSINDPINGSTSRTLAYYTDQSWALDSIREFAQR
jgi:hypothetical protein